MRTIELYYAIVALASAAIAAPTQLEYMKPDSIQLTDQPSKTPDFSVPVAGGGSVPSDKLESGNNPNSDMIPGNGDDVDVGYSRVPQDGSVSGAGSGSPDDNNGADVQYARIPEDESVSGAGNGSPDTSGDGKGEYSGNPEVPSGSGNGSPNPDDGGNDDYSEDPKGESSSGAGIGSPDAPNGDDGDYFSEIVDPSPEGSGNGSSNNDDDGYSKDPKDDSSSGSGSGSPSNPDKNDDVYSSEIADLSPEGTGEAGSDEDIYQPEEKSDIDETKPTNLRELTKPSPTSSKPDYGYGGVDSVIIGKERVPICSKYEPRVRSGFGGEFTGRIRLGNTKLAKFNFGGRVGGEDGLLAARGGLSLMNGNLFKVGAGGAILGKSLGKACVEASALGGRGRELVRGQTSGRILSDDGLVDAGAEAGMMGDAIVAGVAGDAISEKGLAGAGGKFKFGNFHQRGRVATLHDGKLVEGKGRHWLSD